MEKNNDPEQKYNNLWVAAGLIGLAIVSGIVDKPVMWVISLISVIIYFELNFIKSKKFIENKDRAMGNRLIEGMKVLSNLCSNAFDHLKDHKLKIDKTNGKLGEINTRLHRLDQQKHRLDSRAIKEFGNQEEPQPNSRANGAEQVSTKKTGRIVRNREVVYATVPDVKRGSKQSDGN